MKLQGSGCYVKIFQGYTQPEILMTVYQCAQFSTIRVLCMNVPSDASHSTLQTCLHMWIYQMEIYGYPHAV